MDAALHDLIARLHAQPARYVLCATGGGTGAAAWLLAVPGGSKTILEIQVPYDNHSLDAFLGQPPEQYCAADTAHALAERARERARWLDPQAPVAGVGCTASLRSDRPERGEHRVHLAVHTDTHTHLRSLVLAKEARSRAEEEEVVDRLLLATMAEALGVADPADVLLLPGEVVDREDAPRTDALSAFLAGALPAICVLPDGRVSGDAPRPTLVLAGSFDPLHEGHTRMAAVAARITGRPAAFELTAVNADKAPLWVAALRARLPSFAWVAPLWLTRAPTFPEKAVLFPGATFVVGADTAARIVQPRFYGGTEEGLAQAMQGLRQCGARFLVAGRVRDGGDFVGLEQLAIPAPCRDLFEGIPAEAFRLDISSTQLRAAAP